MEIDILKTNNRTTKKPKQTKPQIKKKKVNLISFNKIKMHSK